MGFQYESLQEAALFLIFKWSPATTQKRGVTQKPNE